MELHSNNHELFCREGERKRVDDHLITTCTCKHKKKNNKKTKHGRFLSKSSRQTNRQLENAFLIFPVTTNTHPLYLTNPWITCVCLSMSVCLWVCVRVCVCVFRHCRLCCGSKPLSVERLKKRSVLIHHREKWKMPLKRDIPLNWTRKRGILGKPVFTEQRGWAQRLISHHLTHESECVRFANMSYIQTNKKKVLLQVKGLS